MIHSMTAFASGEADSEDYHIGWELRSVNHRYLDISLRLPDMCRFLEPQIRAAVSSSVRRGKVDCTLTLKPVDPGEQTLRVDRKAVQALLQAAGEIESMMVNAAPFNALDILQWPGVRREREAHPEGLKDTIFATLQEALTQLSAMREREGNHLSQVIRERCADASLLVERARERMPVILDNLRAKLGERVRAAVQEPDTERLEQELVYLAQKLDVEEELDRLRGHLEEVGRVLAQGEPAGRRLDFLLQEMNREANTLGSKSADAEMTRVSVDLKVLIEQMREQVQNIE